MLLVAISGKRCVGKDTLAALLEVEIRQLGINVEVRSLAASFKARYAQEFGLDYQRLLNDRNYKEQHREHMNQIFQHWHLSNPTLCCTEALSNSSQVLIGSDVRLQTDLAFLFERAGGNFFTIRLTASDALRTSFGWKPDETLDQHWTECDLDTVPDDQFFCISNPGTLEALREQARLIAKQIQANV